MLKKQEKMTLEKLAVMIKGGFDDVDKKLEEARIENDRQHEEIKKELKEEFKKEINQLRLENSIEHDDLKLRQDNACPVK